MSTVVLAVVAVALSAAFLASAAAPTSGSTHLVPASGSTEQWAFGGVASGSYSCSDSSCFGNVTTNESFSFSYQYYIEWVAIFTQTNVSSSQTMIETQAALNASAKYAFSGCFTNGSGPCQSESASVSLAGKESAVGFTNLTTGSVTESWPNNDTVPAIAIMNAASQESFNFSGSYSFTAPVGTGGTTESASANFVFGADETSSATFSTPLGVVPLSPTPGETWNSSAPFSATGQWTSGYSFSVSGYTGAGGSESNWTSGAVSPSGTLFVNGTDLGQYTLYDNYSTPATQVTAQAILLNFNNGTFEASDGWVLLPFGMYGGVLYGLSGLAESHGVGGAIAQVVPQTSLVSAPTTESAYYEQGHGFIGAGASGSTGSTSGLSGPSINLTAGPEPVSVAQQQYNAVLSTGASSSSSFPLFDVILVVVVIVVVAALAVVLLTRRRRRATPGAPGMVPAAGGVPPGSQPPTMQSAPAVAPPPPAASPPTTPVCPHCGQPSTYIAQYGRYYCYTDKQYL